MSENPFDDLPDELKKIIYDIMNKIKDFDFTKLEDVFSEMLNSSDIQKLTDLMKDGKFNPFMMNLGNLQGFENFMQNMQANTTNNPEGEKFTETETPYYEIIDKNEELGEIIIDLPGILDIRHINWIQNQDTLELFAENDECKYQVDIILPKNAVLNATSAQLKNTVFILPFNKNGA